MSAKRKKPLITVRYEKREIPAPYYVVVDTGRRAPDGGPSAVIANPTDQADRVTPRERGELQHYVGDRARGQLYLCPSCGQHGTLSFEWLAHAIYRGPVHCPACAKPMDETTWPQRPTAPADGA
jgi:hypothetical protein